MLSTALNHNTLVGGGVDAVVSDAVVVGVMVVAESQRCDTKSAIVLCDAILDIQHHNTLVDAGFGVVVIGIVVVGTAVLAKLREA